LKVKNLDVQESKVILYLKNAYTSDDSLGVPWGNAEKKAQEVRQKFEEILFAQFLHQFDLEEETAEIILEGNSTGLFYVRIFYDQEMQKVNTEEKIAVSKAEGKIKISIKKLKFLKNSYGKVNLSMSTTRKNLEKCLRAYYAKKGAYLVGKSKWREINIYENELTFEVHNISYEILDDIGYHELIRWEITVERVGEEVLIDYKLYGKWGSGYWEPRKSDYIDMESTERYKKYIPDYQEKMESEIRKCLSKKIKPLGS